MAATVADCQTEGVILLDVADGSQRIIYCDKELENITGYGMDEIAGRDFVDIIQVRAGILRPFATSV